MRAIQNMTVIILCAFYGTSYSGGMGSSCTPADVTSPCLSKGWGVAAEALYLRADFPSLNYIGSTRATTMYSRDEVFISKKFNYGFGFKLEGFYNTQDGRDIDLNWYHYQYTTQQNLPSPINVFDTSFADAVIVRLNPRWDAVNLEFAQRLDINTLGNLRLHGGLQYADMQLSNVTTGSRRLLDDGIQRNNTSTYQGVGVRVGADLFRPLRFGLGVYSNIASALLIGNQKFYRNIYTVTAIGPGVFSDANHGSAISTVTELEGKLGLTYSHSMLQGLLRINAGWMWVNYYSAIQVADSFHNGRTKESNFSLQGPFVGLKWAGNLA